MRFSFSWLKHYLDTSLSAQEVGDIFTSIGHEVEGLEDPKALLRSFIVAYVEETLPHPNADKLKICKIRIAKDTPPLTIVCGASNAKAGMYSVFASQGTYIPGTGITLKPTSIRGVESQGMLCSKKELLLADESTGIINLEEDLGKKDFIPGTPFTEIYPVPDTLFHLKITPNRPDCFGVFGLARDLQAKGVGTLKNASSTAIPGTFPNPILISIDLPTTSSACTQFIGRFIRGVKNRPSPLWLQERLREAGLNPISALVDITNYVSVDRARPLHVFDANKLRGALTIRFAKPGEEILALNDKTYVLTEQDLLVADAQGPVALAGIMGGKESGCSLETQDVLLECAMFDAVSIAQTGQRHQIISDARSRFERGMDPLSTPLGIDLATSLILEICGGEVSTVTNVTHGPAYAPHSLSFNPDIIKEKSSVSIPLPKIENYLDKLGFTFLAVPSFSRLTRKSSEKDPRTKSEDDTDMEYRHSRVRHENLENQNLQTNRLIKSDDDKEEGKHFTLQIPSWRPDIEIPEDLVEEILRLEGYDKIPSLPLPPLSTSQDETASLTPFQQKVFYLKRLLAQRGYLEVLTYSFVEEKEATLFITDPQKLIPLANPISQDMKVMRPSLLPSLLKALAYNMAYGQEDAAFMETGLIFKGRLPQDQILTLAGIRKGTTTELSWLENERKADIYDCKADIYACLEAWGLPSSSFQLIRENLPSWMHPHLSGIIQQGPKRILGYFGALHPKILKDFDLKGPCVAFELYLPTLSAPKLYKLKKEPFIVAPYQKVTRDFAFIVDAHKELGSFFEDIRKLDPTLVERIDLFDVYQGKGLPENKKSLGIRVLLSPKKATLTESEIQAFSDNVIQLAAKNLEATLRE